jgi:hypothetical protein
LSFIAILIPAKAQTFGVDKATLRRVATPGTSFMIQIPHFVTKAYEELRGFDSIHYMGLIRILEIE